MGRERRDNIMADQQKPRAADHDSYGLYSILALILPVVGVILGIIMLTKDDPLDKKLGEHTLVCSVFGFILSGIAWILITSSLSTSQISL